MSQSECAVTKPKWLCLIHSAITFFDSRKNGSRRWTMSRMTFESTNRFIGNPCFLRVLSCSQFHGPQNRRTRQAGPAPRPHWSRTSCVPECGPTFSVGQQSGTGGVLPPVIQVLQRLFPTCLNLSWIQYTLFAPNLPIPFQVGVSIRLCKTIRTFLHINRTGESLESFRTFCRRSKPNSSFLSLIASGMPSV